MNNLNEIIRREVNYEFFLYSIHAIREHVTDDVKKKIHQNYIHWHNMEIKFRNRQQPFSPLPAGITKTYAFCYQDTMQTIHKILGQGT